MPTPIAVARAVPVEALSPAEWDEVWTFTARYTDATRDAFERSVRGKKVFVFLRSELRRVRRHWRGRRRRAPGRGARRDRHLPRNTLVDERCGGQNLIQAEGFRQYLRAKAKHPFRPVYLMYDTFSYKSYLMLSRNFRTFWRGASSRRLRSKPR